MKQLIKKSIGVLLVLSTVALVSYGCDGGSNVCSESISVSNTSGARLYYPCNINSSRGATTLTSGYTGTYSQVSWLAEDMVNNGGYIVLAMTPSNIYGMVSGWRDAHKSGIARLQGLNSTHRTLAGRINQSKLQTCGHSKGGGGALWASAELGSTLRTTIGMAPWQEQFTSLTLRSIRAATLIQAGASDTLATGSMTLGEYNALPAISKAYIRYRYVDHMDWASSGSYHSRLGGDINAWMKYYLDGETSYATTIANTSGTTMHMWAR
jgi:hypothetical protein